jgi:hypothetical protein
MKTKLVWALTVVCVLGALSSPARADVRFTHIRSEGDGVWAGFDVIDTTSCTYGIVTHVFIHSNTYTADWNGIPVNTGTTTLVISVWDYCLDAEVRSLVGTTTQQELQVDPNLGAASLHSTFPVLDDVTRTFVWVTLDLLWDATGGFLRDRGGYREHFENGMTVVRSSGTSRDALAAGSMTLDGVERALPPTTEAQVEGNTRRETTVIRN